MDCKTRECAEPAVIFIRTTRPRQGAIKTTVWWGGEGAPATADALCGGHGKHLMRELMEVLT